MLTCHVCGPPAQVVKQLVDDATKMLALEKAAANERQQLEREAAEIFKQREGEALASYEAAELEAIRQRAHFVLQQLKPRPQGIDDEAVEKVKEKLQDAAEAEANAAFEVAKATAAEASKVEAEAKLAEQQAKLAELQAAAAEEAAAAAAAADPEGGEGAAPAVEPVELDEPMVDVEAAVAEAVAAVQVVPVKEITDGDILSDMNTSGITTRAHIIQAMAIHSLGDLAYVHHPIFNPPPPPPEPEPVAPPKRR